MSDRHTIQGDEEGRVATGLEGASVPSDNFLPSCGVEDLDSAVFKLFDKTLPLYFTNASKEMKRIPVVFAGGERFALTSRGYPIRDRANAYILPIISIKRGSFEQTPALGVTNSQMMPMVVRTRIDSSDPTYQALSNGQGLVNQANVSSDQNIVGFSSSRTVNPGAVKPTGAVAGTATRRRQRRNTDFASRTGRSLMSPPEKSIYEIVTMPPSKLYSISYNVVVWSQYMQQMNNIIESVISSYNNMPARSFKIETEKGYWFTLYVDNEIETGDNFDDMTENERIVKCSFNMKAMGYVIQPDYPGSSTGLRRFISAPIITFDISAVSAPVVRARNRSGPMSGDATDHALDDLSTDGPQSHQIGEGSSGVEQEYEQLTGQRRSSSVAQTADVLSNSSIGGFSNSSESTGVVEFLRDPLTGENRQVTTVIKSSLQRKGETVYGGTSESSLETLVEDD